MYLICKLLNYTILCYFGMVSNWDQIGLHGKMLESVQWKRHFACFYMRCSIIMLKRKKDEKLFPCVY